ncbi:MAG: hypothetical protein RLZZ558_526 [Planctomycetota bacterium]|jgi:hypothetical protein
MVRDVDPRLRFSGCQGESLPFCGPLGQACGRSPFAADPRRPFSPGVLLFELAAP